MSINSTPGGVSTYDGNGNITYLVNSSQTVAASYRYDAYGNTISSSGSLASDNTYRFSSKMIFANGGIYYYGYRWYDPNLQRWLNRDPLGDRGFQIGRLGAEYGINDLLNLYSFVSANPVSNSDPFGLSIWKCTRQTEWSIPGLQHVYLWDDRPGTTGSRACGRDGAGVNLGPVGKFPARGVSNPKDTGPHGSHSCVEIPNSGGKEDAVMACCRTPRYKPFPKNDCHDWTENCLTANSLPDPEIYGRFKGPGDQVNDWCSTYPGSMLCWIIKGGRF